MNPILSAEIDLPVININMRCIEMLASVPAVIVSREININMRCIEIILVSA